MTPYILAALGLWLAQTFFAASFKTVLAPNAMDAVQDHMRGKDESVALSVQGARAQRAQQNLLESLVVFLPLALLVEVQGEPSAFAVQGAALFVGARLFYAPAYHLAVWGVRTATWTLALVGMSMMAWALLV